jgi:hypothetical protein
MTLHPQRGSCPELSEHDAAHLRFRLATGPKSNVGLGRHVLDVAQHDFVNRRQQSRDRGTKLDGEEDFHRWLTLTRLCARSKGRDEACIQDWKNALRLDDAIETALTIEMGLSALGVLSSKPVNTWGDQLAEQCGCVDSVHIRRHSSFVCMKKSGRRWLTQSL